MNTMGGPWKARGGDPWAWRRPVTRVEAVTGTDELAAVLAWVTLVMVGAASLMLLAAW